MRYLVAALASCLAFVAADARADDKLLVQDLAPQGVEPHAAAALSTAACHQLAKRKGFDVLCGDDVRAMMQWNQMAASFNNCQDDKCFESTGKALEASLVVSGSVAKVGDEYVLSLTLFDVRHGRSLGRSEVKAQSIESLYKQVGEAVDVVFEKNKKS